MSKQGSWIGRRRYSRRAALRAGGAGAAGLVGAALIGCGGDDEDEPGGGGGAATAAPTTAGTSAATAAPTQASAGSPKTGGTWRTSITGDPPTLDPYDSGSFATKGFAAFVYSRLFKIDAQPETNPYDQPVVPDLAESFETDDGQHWTVVMKPGVKFHNLEPVNGRELVADDVLFTWGRLTRPESVNAAAVENVTNIEAVDDHTLSFTLAAPSPIFLEQLADANNLWVMPSESDGQFEATVTPIGSGPWVMQNYEVSSRFVFAKNPDYFVEGIPLLDGVEQPIIPEYANSKAQMEAGNLHSQGIQADDIITLQGAHGDWQWLGEVTGGVGYMFFSSAQMDPDAPWQDERFRQAISMGIDRAASMDLSYNTEALKEAGLNPSEAWNNAISVSLGRWWLDPQSPEQGESSRYFQYDVAEAQKLLAAADATGAPMKWQYAGTRYGPTFDRYAEALGNWMLELGLAIETEVQDYASVYFPQTRAGDFHGAALGITPAYPEVSGFVDRFFSDSSSNASMVDDPTLNDLRARQALEFDIDARRDLIHEIQRVNATHMYYLPTPLGGGTSYTAYHPAARGIRRTRGYGSPSEVYPHLWLDA